MTTAMTKVTPKQYGLADLKETAQMIIDGGIFPQWRKIEAIVPLMMKAQDEGRSVLSVMERFDFIGGRLAKRSQAILEDFISAGGTVDWVECTDEKAVGKFVAPNKSKITETWTIEDGRKAGLLKPNSAWYKYPKAMLRARCLTSAIRAIYPNAVPILSEEEAKDLPPAEPKNVTPEAEKPTPTETPTGESKQVIAEAEVVKDEKKTQEQVTEKVAEVEKEKPAEDDINKGTVQEFIATLPKAKVAGFLKEVRWPKVADLTETNLKAIDEARPSFKKNVEKWVKGQI